MNKLVSIIVPCYNQAQYLPEALQSVLDQTYSDWECIIVNDGSPDDTDVVAKKWLIKDIRFKYIYKENGGLSSARNAGIEIAVGTYILPLDADDKIGRDYLKLAAQAFEHNVDLKLVYCKAEKFGDEFGEWKLPCYSIENLASENMIFCSSIYKRVDWEVVGGYDLNMIYGLEDWEFWISLLKFGGKVSCLGEVNFYYRITGKSMVGQLNVEKRKILFEYMSIKHADFFVKQLGSFMYLKDLNREQEVRFKEKLKSKKNLFKMFFNKISSYFKLK